MYHKEKHRKVTTGHSRHITTADKSFKNAAEFQYLGMAVTHQNLINL